ncbi:MAG: hybrid sensor histidine kinase/response regulator [Deltaproteobacteria bacterium]|nr:hybrid sensor histidine kinase/response regulator [Deltaproteobacteria bacterium]MCW5805997.1 hybrid sensor histidine kinase/response regulator [Deltaproteobacteria bacterium]
MKTARILVVDDDDHVREALVDELSPTYRVEAVSCGGEAFDALSMHQYDVVISDLKMPDHDGIEVLEFARRHQRDAVRVLLTGYLDERAQRALMTPDAPYKVGKPWHDEIEIVVRRGLEQRELARRLSASVEDALSLSTFDEELNATRTPLELSQAIVRRALTVEGVIACGTIVRENGAEHLFTGGSVTRDGPGWHLDLPLDLDGDLRLRARGVTDSSRQLVQYMAHRAQRACGVLEARVASLQPLLGNGNRMNQLMRQATLGALTSSLLHDLASTMQALSAALNDITMLANGQVPGLDEAIADATAAGDESVQLFVQMRKFIRDGDVHLRPTRLDRLVQRVVKIAGGYVRERAQLRVGELPEIEIAVNESLFLQVLANLLRNAANASPRGGIVDVRVRVEKDEVVFTVVDDGPGVAPSIADTMFEPFATGTDGGTGLGLAISAYVMQMLEGRISYRKDPDRGASFSVAIPCRSAPAAAAGD